MRRLFLLFLIAFLSFPVRAGNDAEVNAAKTVFGRLVTGEVVIAVDGSVEAYTLDPKAKLVP